MERQRASRGSILAWKEDSGGHLLHRQVPDAGGEGCPTRGAAAQLLAALVTYEVASLALQDGRQDIVKAYRALEQRRQLVVLLLLLGHLSRYRRCRRRGRWRGGRAGGSGDRGAGDRRGWSVWRRRRLLLLFPAGLTSTGSGGGRAAHVGRNQPWNLAERCGEAERKLPGTRGTERTTQQPQPVPINTQQAPSLCSTTVRPLQR